MVHFWVLEMLYRKRDGEADRKRAGVGEMHNRILGTMRICHVKATFLEAGEPYQKARLPALGSVSCVFSGLAYRAAFAEWPDFASPRGR
jgi:hypothetical protein